MHQCKRKFRRWFILPDNFSTSKTYPVVYVLHGYGALYLAFQHQDVFGAAGSLSGGVDFRPFPYGWHIPKRLGAYAKNPDNWEKNTVINLVHLLTPNAKTNMRGYLK